MEIKKLLAQNIGEHHPEEALIFSSNGDILMTRKDQETEGYPLMRLYSSEQVQALIKAEVAAEIQKITISPKCDHHYNSGGYQSSC